MRIEPDGSYLMPVSFGPTRPLKAGVFREVLTLSTRYVTDRDALAALLPEPYEATDLPVVTVYYQQCRGVNFLAGGGYNLMGINLAAFFNGKQDQVTGEYALVLWENDAHPILRGRELLGLPKIFGEIPDPFRLGEDWRVQVSENGHLLVEMTIARTLALEGDAPRQLAAQQNQTPWLGWRYIPKVTGAGAAISQATQIGIERTFDEVWSGTGTVSFGNEARWETCPLSGDILDAVKRLVVKEYIESTITRGSQTLTRALNRVLE
jgi:acetoacetate decarboxylase